MARPEELSSYYKLSFYLSVFTGAQARLFGSAKARKHPQEY